MNELHATYRQALRASGIGLSDRDTALAFELAKAVNANIDMGLWEWAQVHTKVNAEYPAKPVEQAKAERKYWAFSEIGTGEIHWPKAC